MQVNSVNSNNCASVVLYNNTCKKHNNVHQEVMKNSAELPFCGFFSDWFVNKFANAEEKQMYKELRNVLSGKDKANLELLYETGRLTSRDSNNHTSTVENLYKIYKNPRIAGLDNKKILSETIEHIANPFIITQKFGIIPTNIANEALKQLNTNTKLPNMPKSVEDMKIKNSASCVAASIEFSLADKKPAEYARFVEGLSSPGMQVIQNVKLSNLNKNILDAVHLLNMFNVKAENPSWDSVNVTIKPDRDAIIRARVQGTKTDNTTRDSIDVLLQSAFMQLGSQNTYNSLTDKRYGALNANDTGLTEFEKTFVESVVGNDGEKTSVVYQNVNDNSILEGYFHSADIVKKHILDTLATNKNVIVGITETDSAGKIIGGHEMTIVGYKNSGNNLSFVCNDTDDNYVGAVEISAKDLLPKIHHAGIPIEILGNVKDEDKGLSLLKQYSDKNKKS